MDPITLALGAAKIIPALVGLFKGKRAGNVAEQVLDVAKTLTGNADPKTAMEQIEADPNLQIEFQKAMQPVLIRELEEETKQLQAVNETMQVEYNTKSKFKSWWRPAFGWVVVITWFSQMAAVSYVILTNIDKAVELIGVMASLSFMWAMALATLGINIHKRSQDKQTATGQNPLGLLGMLFKR